MTFYLKVRVAYSTSTTVEEPKGKGAPPPPNPRRGMRNAAAPHQFHFVVALYCQMYADVRNSGDVITLKADESRSVELTTTTGLNALATGTYIIGEELLYSIDLTAK